MLAVGKTQTDYIKSLTLFMNLCMIIVSEHILL